MMEQNIAYFGSIQTKMIKTEPASQMGPIEEEVICNPNKRQKINSGDIKPITTAIPSTLNHQCIKQENNLNGKRPIIVNIIKEQINFPQTVYSLPKRYLHNAFMEIARQLKDKTLLLVPTYNIVKVKGTKKTWCCTYTPKWPCKIEFKKIAQNKQQASNEAALATLSWLKENSKITSDCRPIIQKSPKNGLQKKLYASPKHVLHNTYNEVSQKLHNNKLKLETCFNKAEESKERFLTWSCKYTLKWPELREFDSEGLSKKEASEDAALSALVWLKNHQKINEKGHPIIAKKEKKKKKTLPGLQLTKNAEAQIRAIVKHYNEELKPKITKEMSSRVQDKEEGEKRRNAKILNFKQRFQGVHKYLAKEEIPLPISTFKSIITELIGAHRVIIIKGEPGCGKSTRVPQYVLEAWAVKPDARDEPCKVAVTQPRRIAAISLAERVAQERSEECGLICGFQVRLNSNFCNRTGRILFCTNGILLRHLQSDASLSEFSHVILDEAHERDANGDLLMSLLKKTLEKNSRLKLIVMSATVDTELFSNYFNGAPVLNIPGFAHPVQSYFLDDIGLNLVKTRQSSAGAQNPNVVHDEVAKVINHIHQNKQEGAILCFLPGWSDILKIQQLIMGNGQLSVLCLHSKLKDGDQWRIFQKPEIGRRKVILSTNIAETSVTIDDVVYVIDSGIHKESRFDNLLGVTCIDNQWISQASMIQRKGRAGRVRPGESFHLFTKSKYNSLPEFSQPEIQRIPLTKMVLDSKIYSENITVLDFMQQLPSPPDQKTIQLAIQQLQELELFTPDEQLNALGKVLAQYQLEPKLAKMLVNSIVYKCVTPIVDIITIFSAEIDLFANGLRDQQAIREMKENSDCPGSDHLSMMVLFENWLEQMEDFGELAAQMFCEDTNMIHGNLQTVEKLRCIHFEYINKLAKTPQMLSDVYSDCDELVKAVLISGIDTVLYHRQTTQYHKGIYQKKNVLSNTKDQKASITSDSMNFKTNPTSYLVFLNETRSSVRRTNIIRECSVVSPLSLLLFSYKVLTTEEEANGEVVLGLEDSPLEFRCSKLQASDIANCRKCLNEAYKYFIQQLTQRASVDMEVMEVWDQILGMVNEVLVSNFKSQL